VQETASSTGRLFGPEMLANPYPVYDRLRSTSPVHWDEASNGWALTRYADVVSVLRSPHVSSERARLAQQGAPAEFQPLYASRVHSMLHSDPPSHTRLRLLVSQAFTPAAVEAQGRLIRRVLNRILKTARDHGRMDLLHDLAAPLSISVIAAMLGVPPEDRERFKRWADDIVAALGNIRANLRPEHLRRAVRSTRALTSYFREVISERRRPRRGRPRRDLLGDLLQAEAQGDRLTEDELYANAMLLLNAGHETTTNLIGNGMLALLRHPDQLERLREDPALISTAIEELLRFDSPVQFIGRLLKQDLTVGGKRLRRGQTVWLLLGAANRDPEQFVDPDRLDVGRRHNKHVAFGLGVHFCLGAPLARLEGRIALETVLRRLPGLRLDGPMPEYRDNFNFRGLKALPVAFSPAVHRRRRTNPDRG
jgi:cytochrome P450